MKMKTLLLLLSWIIIINNSYAQQGNWSVVNKIDTSIIYKKISCYDSLNCLACATLGFTKQEYNVFRKTFDGGNNWLTISVDKGYAVRDEDSSWLYWKYPPAIKSIDCFSEKHCMAVHDSGYISISSDGGIPG